MYRKPVVLLLVLTIFIPELMTGSTPLNRLVQPGFWLLYLFAYGIPVLLIRELAVRFNVGLCGLACFGLAYGIVNEGLFAKTLVRAIHLPVSQYDHYGYAFGISFTWMAVICTWHAFASCVFPIAFVYYLYPDSSSRPWLKLPTAFVLYAVEAIIACTFFLKFKVQDTRNDPGLLVLLLLFMLILFVIGLRFRGEPIEIKGSRAIGPVVCGFSTIVVFLFLAVLAGGRAPLPLFFLAVMGIAALYWRTLTKRDWRRSPALLCFAIGLYTGYAAFSLLALLHNPVLLVITAVVDAAVLLLMWRSLGPSKTNVTSSVTSKTTPPQAL